MADNARAGYLPCAECRGRGFVMHKTGYLKSVIGTFYRGRVARDFCFTCRGTGTVPFVPADESCHDDMSGESDPSSGHLGPLPTDESATVEGERSR